MVKRIINAATVAAIILLVPLSVRAQGLSPADSFVLSIGERIPGRHAADRDVRSVPVVAIRTARPFSCLLPLALKAEGSSTRAIVTVTGIAKVIVCPSAVGPATGHVELALAFGRDTLDIVSEGRRDRYLVHVTDAALAVDEVGASFTRFDTSLLQRAPANSMAFYCMVPWTRTGPDPRQLHICPDFVQWLVDSLGAHEFEFHGKGEIAFPARNDLTRADTRYFSYEQPEVFALAYDLLQRYSRSVMVKEAPNAFIELQNWRGTLISSYRCQPWQGCESMPSRPRY